MDIQTQATEVAPQTTQPQTEAAAKEATATPSPAEPTKQPTSSVGEVAAAAAKKFAKQPETSAEPEKKWEPNWKFKVLKEEKELDEKYRAWVKDPESEKSVKELVSKSMAFDWMKERHQELRETHNQVVEQHQALMDEIEQLKAAHQRGDYETFFNILNIPEQRILQWVANKLQYEQLPPEQRAIYEARKKAEREAYSLQSENARLQEQLQQEAIQARTFMLDTLLGSAEVKSFADQFDARVGRPGAFREEVINRGKMAYYSRGVDLTPEQAIQEVMSILGASGFQQQPAATAGQHAPAMQQSAKPFAAAPQPAAKPPIIPNVQGRASASPAKDRPKSIEDIKRKYYEMSGQYPG